MEENMDCGTLKNTERTVFVVLKRKDMAGLDTKLFEREIKFTTQTVQYFPIRNANMNELASSNLKLHFASFSDEDFVSRYL